MRIFILVAALFSVVFVSNADHYASYPISRLVSYADNGTVSFAPASIIVARENAARKICHICGHSDVDCIGPCR